MSEYGSVICKRKWNIEQKYELLAYTFSRPGSSYFLCLEIFLTFLIF